MKIKRKTAAEEASGDTDETLTDNVSGAFGLSSLDIDDVNLSPGFDTEIYQYTIDLTKDLTSWFFFFISIAKDLLDRNGGSIDIRSEVGKGTEVVIKIPTKTNIKK